MPLLPVAMYGLEVPADGMPVPCCPDFPATFRITMAALDPDESIAPASSSESTIKPRATLKLIREIDEGDDESLDDEDEALRGLLAGSVSDSESESDSDDEKVNGGPSDPKKSMKAQRMSQIRKLVDSVGGGGDSDEDEDVEMGEGVNGVSKKDKGKGKADSDEEEESVEGEDIGVEEFVLCTLDPEKTFQQPLDITIAENEQVFFKVTGTHTVYITGNYVIPDDDGHNHHHEVYDSDSDEDYDLSPDEDEEIQMDEEESDELDDLEDPRITEVDTDEDEVPKLTTKIEIKSDKKGKNKRTADEIDGPSLDDIMAKSLKAETEVKEEPKLSKKQLKKLKKNNGEAVGVKSDETKENVKNGDANTSKKVQFAKNLEQGPTSSAEKPKGQEKKEPTINGKATLGVKVVNGVTVDDKKLGSGRACKRGDRVGMRYIGKLMDGKVFDSNKKGKPFEFKLGDGKVIKGWDIGVAGMSAGGERRMTVPANLAYGSKSLPGIPANSTLTFDVKLLEIK